METEQNTRNLLRDTRKNITFVIIANRKLTRDEMLRELRLYNFNPNKDKHKSGDNVVIYAQEEYK
jgi:hypothetical protein